MKQTFTNFGYAPNKQFKSDSARVAFLLCVGFSGLGGMRQLRYCVPHTLIGRYMQWVEIFMKGFNSILTGFSWGMGFSVALILSGLVYTKFVEPSLGNILEDKEIDDKAIEYLAD
ncbi:hypothetical protein [Vibrio harveyi]